MVRGAPERETLEGRRPRDAHRKKINAFKKKRKGMMSEQEVFRAERPPDCDGNVASLVLRRLEDGATEVCVYDPLGDASVAVFRLTSDEARRFGIALLRDVLPWVTNDLHPMPDGDATKWQARETCSGAPPRDDREAAYGRIGYTNGWRDAHYAVYQRLREPDTGSNSTLAPHSSANAAHS